MTDSWLTVWEEGGELYTVEIADEPRIDAAVSQHVDSGGTRDALLHLTFTDGREYTVRASRIVSWAASTPETRRRAMEYEQWQKEETETFKQELGIWEDA